MKVRLPEDFEHYFDIQNARERMDEAREVARRLLQAGIGLKHNPDHYAMFCDPPRLLAGPLKRVGYVLGLDNRCYPSPVDGCDYINVAASLPAESPAPEKGWPDHVAVVHPVDDAAWDRIIEQGYGNPFIHHITWGIELPSPLPSDEIALAAAMVSRMAAVRRQIGELLGESPGTLIMALPKDVLENNGFWQQISTWVAPTPREEYQLEIMEGGGHLLQFFVLKGGRIEVAMRLGTRQTFNPKSVHKISRDELSVNQGHQSLKG
jgi:hypothetical protein